MRQLLCLAVFGLVSASLAQQPKVTYTTVAVPAKKAIADLAQKSGMNIQCSPSMEKEILILRLKDAPMDEVMKQIAAVTSGSWNKEGEIYYLVANGSARQIEANKIQKRLTDKIALTLKKQQEAMTKQPKGADADDEDMPAMFGYMGQSPTMTKLALAIGASQLGSVPEDGRVVFSTNPTRMQRSLPGNTTSIINDFVVEYNKMAAQVKQEEPAKAGTDENMSAFMELFSGRMKKPKPITTAPAKAIVVAERNKGMFSSYSLELKLYDAAGKLLANSSTQLTTGMVFGREIATGAPDTKAPPKPEGKEIKLSALASELRNAGGGFPGMGGGAGSLKFSKELMDVLKDPVGHDPLSFSHSEALIAVAEEKNSQLVANLPDGVLSMFGNFRGEGGGGEKLTTETFLTDIKGEDKAQILDSNGWLIVSPENPVQARQERTDRKALKTLIDASQSQGYVSLDQIAAYATKNESPMEGAPASMMYIMLFAPNTMQQGMMGSVNWDLLRLYGLLADDQKQGLRKGTQLRFGQLTPGQQAQVVKMLFGADSALTVESQTRGPKQDPLTEMMFSQMQRFGGGNEADFQTEPTEIMPNGLPSDGYIVVNFTTEPVGQSQTMSTDFGRGSSLSAMELGLFKFFKEDPQMSQIAGAMPTLDDIKVGTRSVYNFSFYVAPSVVEKQVLNDDLIPKDAQIYKLTNLPADFQKRIDEMAASFKNNPMWKMMGQMGGMNQRVMPPQ